MIVFAVLLLSISTVSLLGLATFEWRYAYRQHRSEQANLEHQKYRAERRLHDLSSRAFGEMLDAARQASGSDRPWGS
jgi:Flp pilus assembly protein TadB